MPAKAVLQFECDRCDRVWYEDVTEQALQEPHNIKLLHLVGSMPARLGIQVTFETLCEGCNKTVETALKTIAKELKNKSPSRGAKKEDPTVKSDPPALTEKPSGAVPPAGAAGSGVVGAQNHPSAARASTASPRPNAAPSSSGRSG